MTGLIYKGTTTAGMSWVYDRFCDDRTCDLFCEYQLRLHTGHTIGRITDHRLRPFMNRGPDLHTLRLGSCTTIMHASLYI